MVNPCSGQLFKGNFTQSQQNNSGFICCFTSGTPVTDLLTLSTGCGTTGDPCRACCPPAVSRKWEILPPSPPFLRCFTLLFISLFSNSLSTCLFYLLSVTWVVFDLLSLQCKYDKGKWCHVYYFPTRKGRIATRVTEQNTWLKFSIFITFSALLLNCGDRTDDSDGAKLFGQSYVTANCVMNPGVLKSWISGVWELKPIFFFLLKNL